MLTREQKETIVREVTDDLKGAKSVVFIDYKGLGVTDMTQLKAKLREEGGVCKVMKKKLFFIAAKNSGVEIDPKALDGQFAVIFSPNDEVSGAKIVYTFAESNENVKILGGMLESDVIDTASITALAKLPSKEELLAKMVGSIKAPVSGFVNVLSGNMRGLVTALKAISSDANNAN